MCLWWAAAGGLEDSQELLLMSPALELSRSMTNILRSEAPTKVDVFQVSQLTSTLPT